MAPSSPHRTRLLLAAGVAALATAGAPLVGALAQSAPPATFGEPRAAVAFRFMVCDTLVRDLNADGRPEFVGGDHLAPGLGIAVNATPRRGAPPRFSRVVDVRFPAAAGASAGLAAVDVNADGRPDLASANHTGTLAVLVNRTPARAPAIRFSRATTVDLQAGPMLGAEGSVGGVAAADFDLDGRPDLATANFGNSTSAIVLNRTAPRARVARLSAPRRFGVGGNPVGIAAGDLDGDGRPDVVTANVRGGSLSVLLNRTTRSGRLRFARRDVAVGSGPSFLALADLDRDGRLDVVSTDWNDRTLTVLTNRTRRGAAGVDLRTAKKIRLRSRGLIVRAEDLDGDRRPDLVAIPLDPSSRTLATVVLNRTARPGAPVRFAPPRSHPVPVPNRAQHYTATGAVGDLDGDGRPEISASVVEADFAPTMGEDLFAFLSDPRLADVPEELLPSKANIVLLTRPDR